MASTYGALVLVQVFFGLWPVAAAGVFDEVSPPALIGFRTLVGAPLMMAMIPGAWRLWPPSVLLRFAGLGLLGVGANQLLYVYGLERAGPVNAAILVTFIPIVTLIAAVAFGKERWQTHRVAGVLLAVVGVGTLVGAERFELDGAFLGSLLILANMTSYGIYLVLARETVARFGALTTVAWVFVFGALEALPFTAGPVLSTPWTSLSAATWGKLAFILVGPTFGTYFLNAYALRRADSSVVAVFIGLQPIVGGIGAWWAFGETMSPRAAFSAVLIVTGVVITAAWERRRRTTEVSEQQGGSPDGSSPSR
ncbi:MAG: DMT family transporter [Myxococcota bacterium]